MKTGFSFKYSRDFIHIVESTDFGQQLPPLKDFWNRLADVCAETKCKKVLAEALFFKNNMTTVEAFEAGEYAGKKIPGLSIACFFGDFEIDRTTEFFKTVAQNRGVRIEFFDSAADALKWLNILRESEKV